MRLRPPGECRFDLVALGEVMLRLDPGEDRVATARSFRAWEGGGEYNVARNLAHCFGRRTAIVTALADNAVGALLAGLMRQGGVDTSLVRWVEYDGVGRAARNGLNFTERGCGVRAPAGCSDRGHTAVSQLRPGELDWEHVFGALGARWFHTGGVFCGLSATTPRVAEEAMQAARRHGAIVSFDFNYRESLWRGCGGRARALEVWRALAPLADVLLGVPPDAAPDEAGDAPGADLAAARQALERACAQFGNVSVAATTLRRENCASRHDCVALALAGGRLHESRPYADLHVLDRVGAGDAFAAGLVHGLLEERGAQYAVECGAALGALALTTPGDAAMASAAEVEALMRGARREMAR
jgi:2-dehydro-3-deoxygluconokinase